MRESAPADKEDPGMIVDCAYSLDGRRSEEGAMSLPEAAARCGPGGFVWLGLFEPDEAELAQVREIFGLHELAVEDAQNWHMRPKIETYDKDVQLIILRTARYDDAAEEVEFGEISVFLSPTFVIAVRQGVASELRGARQRLEQRPELLAAGSSSALWAIMDQVVDGYAPVIAGLERDIDQVEATVFSGAVAPTERIYSLRREATDFYRAVHPLLGVVGIIERAAAPELQPYLRDVRDHVLQPVFEGRHRDPALNDLTVKSLGGGAAVGVPAVALADDDAEIRAADSDRRDRHAQPEIAASAAADQAGEGPRAALQQAEEGHLAAALRVGVLFDDEIRIGA